jgi:hypothetical protein
MIQTIQAKDIDLHYLIDTYGLELIEDNLFFREWQESLPEIADSDKQYLDKVKAGFINLLNNPPLLEDIVRMSVIDPILFLADFYLRNYVA